LEICNTDGGAHVDPRLKQPYFDLTRNNSSGFFMESHLGSTPFEDVHLHSIRQIAHEFMTSIDKQLAKLAT
jgi:hypothetical protein